MEFVVGTHGTWRQCVQQVVSQGRRFIALDLSGHSDAERIGPINAEDVTPALTLCTELMRLNLANQDLGPAGMKYISQAIVDHRHLRRLVLNCNGLGDEGVMLLLPTLEHACELAHICLSGNGVSLAVRPRIAVTVARNPAITSISVYSEDGSNEHATLREEGLRLLQHAYTPSAVTSMLARCHCALHAGLDHNQPHHYYKEERDSHVQELKPFAVPLVFAACSLVMLSAMKHAYG